jgi:hypothetical protein
MIKLTHILEEIVLTRLGYLFEDTDEKTPAKKPRKKTSADKPTEPVDEPVTEPDADAPVDTKKTRSDAKPKKIRVLFRHRPTPEQERLGTVQGMNPSVTRFGGAVKPKTITLDKRSSQQDAPVPSGEAPPEAPPEAPKAPMSAADELRAHYASLEKKNTAATDKRMQDALNKAREELAIRHAATMADATADLDTWYAKKQARIANKQAQRVANKAAGVARIKNGYMVDPKAGLIDVPEDEPTNLDITKYNPKTVAKVSTAYQKFLRLNPTEYQAVEYLRKLLQKNDLPKEFGTAKQSKKFSGGNDAV